jgi:hypothetical protein
MNKAPEIATPWRSGRHKPEPFVVARTLLGIVIAALILFSALATLTSDKGCARTYEQRKTRPLCSSD